ncbi:MAG: hypothetical protein IPL33_03265 [Sphingobacteriales bacterium]|nr:hypothetical protein [Sphingobacteriales bacterium]
MERIEATDALAQTKYRKLYTAEKYETTDSIYSYWLRISDRAAEGTTAPIEYCRPQLRDALRHQQRHHNLQEILQQRYQKALEQGMVEVF